MAHPLGDSNPKLSWRERFRAFFEYLKEYCGNCSLVGFSYIANQNLHWSERIFWLLCVLLSIGGVSYLIVEYQQDFSKHAVSVIYESISSFAPIRFPSISVCQLPPKYDFGGGFEEYIQSLGVGIGEPYNFDVHSQMVFILFPDRYSPNTITKRCKPYEDCEECAKCPKKDFRLLAERLGLNCTDIFNSCSLSGKSFDCCQYFLPMVTPSGTCFLLNSLQNNYKGSEHWFPATLDRNNPPEFHMYLKRAAVLSLFNEEDLPTLSLPAVTTTALLGIHKIFKFYTEALVNDPEIVDIAPEARDCYFPYEVPPWSVHKAYSFSACISDCTRLAQMDKCNCTLYIFNPFNDTRFPDCDFEGLLCLERNGVVKPNIAWMMKYRHPVANCDCLPACTESNIQAIYSQEQIEYPGAKDANITVSMTMWPTNQFHRIALRTKLDIVVTLGGILGLFLGASILSVIEIIYYFTIRAVNTYRFAHRPN
ncbi:sodium channel protein Nach [Drosophila sulfurigaster albostrigata]|uniref:sodium channel protein Nach n=1 Tax=Drosophila sulfurigaster albostrigata TaxID=89887 RepID=UPI002D21B947|nr:sodium channel protein Nach [Drosophila sulfurigaster albostrigata]